MANILISFKMDTKKDALKRLFLCPMTLLTSKKHHSLRFAICSGLFAISLLASQPAVSDSIPVDNACSQTQFDETTSVKYIHDGDTLHLSDGRKVRLIGINTPEVAHGKHAAELFSAEAKQALQALFKNDKSISLIHGEEKKDHYKRLLAHGFTSDGTNIQAALLTQGFAQVIAFPPNTRFSSCYLEQERHARCSKTGLWKKLKPLTAKKLNDTHIGFKLVKGKLKSININKKGIWLNLDNKLTVGIRPDNQHLFDINRLHLMIDKSLVIRGWLNKNKKTKSTARPYYIRIRHPSSIQLSSEFACN